MQKNGNYSANGRKRFSWISSINSWSGSAATESNITARQQQKPQISQITQKKLTKKEVFAP